VTKWFSDDRAADAERELAILRRGVGPRLLKVERSTRGTRLTLQHVGDRHWPRRPESAALVDSLGQALKRVHSLQGILAPSLPASPAKHARGVNRALAGLLAAQERALPAGAPVLCHGDLKPSNVRVEKTRAVLIDFERALFAERAWELGCAVDRLALPPASLPPLWKGAGVRFGNEVARAALYRLAWTFVVAKGPALGGPTAGRLRRGAQERVRALVRFLHRVS
jgi:hypothetical protein